MLPHVINEMLYNFITSPCIRLQKEQLQLQVRYWACVLCQYGLLFSPGQVASVHGEAREGSLHSGRFICTVCAVKVNWSLMWFFRSSELGYWK
uniref:Uncharacterized protein n=1 Tax=Setaria digitata TaxID=48799 RepID=A0A915PHU5_9BILA